MTGILIDTRDAIAATNVDPSTSHIRTAGRSVLGDQGGGLHVRMTTAPSPVRREHTQSLDGAWWLLVPEGDIWFEQFGAKGGLSVDDQPAVQAAFDFAAGSPVRGRKKRYRLDRGVVTPVFNFQGGGKGSGVLRVDANLAAVLGDDYCTDFVANFPDGDIFYAESSYPSILRDCRFNSLVPRVSGAAIHLSGPSSAPAGDLRTQTGSLIDNVGFENQYRCIHGTRVVMPLVNNCFGTSWVKNGIFMDTTSETEASYGNLQNSYWWGNSGSMTQESCITTEVGYGSVHGNILLGGTIGALVRPTNASAGGPRVVDNWIENQGAAGVAAWSGDGVSTMGMAVFARNGYSNLQHMANYVASVSLPDYPAGTNFSVDTRIEGDVHRHKVVNPGFRYILLQSGTGVVVRGEIFENTSPDGPLPTGIDAITGTSPTKLIGPVHLQDNVSIGRVKRYAVDDRSVVRDHQPIALADYPPNVGNGSIFYISDAHSRSIGTGDFQVADHGLGALSWKNGGTVYVVRP